MKRKLHDHNAIATDILERKLNYSQIATKYGCSCRTVQRVAFAKNIGIGQGVKHHWKFECLSPQLSYVLGIYITEGYLPRDYRTNMIRSFVVANTSVPLLDRLETGLRLANLPVSRLGPYWYDKSRKPQFRSMCYSSMFGRWLYEICDNKNKIPEIVMSASQVERRSFLEAVIDGDGSVRKDGSIIVRGSRGYIKMLPDLLQSLHIKNSGCKIDGMLSGNRPYLRVSVKRSDFVKLSPILAIPLKHHRMMFGKDIRDRRRK